MDTNIIDMGIYAKMDNPDQTLFDRLLNENMAEAVLRSIGQYLKITSDEMEDYDTINREMADVTMPDDLAARLQEINRKYIEEYNARTSSDDENNNDDTDFPNAPVSESSDNTPKTSVYDESGNITKTSVYDESDNSTEISVVRGSGSEMEISVSDENEVVESETKESRKVIRMKAFRKYERAMRSLSKVAVVFVAMVGITFTSFSVDADAMRFSLYDIFIKHNKGNADVSIVQNHDPTGLYTEHLQNDDPPEQLPETIGEVKLTDYFEPGEEILYPGYLPKGYSLREIDSNSIYFFFSFKNENGKWIYLYTYMNDKLSINIDTEKSENEIVCINDNDALLNEYGDNYTLNWNLNNKGIRLKVEKNTIDEEEMLKVANSINKLII